MICFGTVPSRRLGKSLGINNIPARKICSFSCRYCQVGLTEKYCITRREFYQPEVIYSETRKLLERLAPKDYPDYLTFVANGEPTLDINLGKTIQKLRVLNIPIAVITNASLLKYQHVQDDLNLADLVSIKIDANDKSTWEAINWPMQWLKFEDHINGILSFASQYKGNLITETMLVKGVNDSVRSMVKTSHLVQQVNPSMAYISLPTRPPAVASVEIPSETVINKAYQIFFSKSIKVALLNEYEGSHTGFTGNAMEDIVNMSAVHPIREETIQEIMINDHADKSILDMLINHKLIRVLKYRQKKYYLRNFH